MLLTFNWEGWDKESAQRYNTEILPTRFGHNETLAALGLDTDVFETLNAMGIAPQCYLTHKLYPDLVRQALATAQIGYDNPQAPTYENCSFSFMADGKFCSLSLDQLNEIYEISDKRTDVAVENKFTLTERIIGLPKGVSVPDQKSYVEGLEDEIRRSRAGIPFQHVQTNPGFHLIWMFYSRKDFLLRTENKKDHCGSLLTPLFMHYGINLQAYAVNYNIEYVDTRYLISSHIFRDETTYRFTDKEGNVLFIKLPQPHLTNFSSIENIRFLPDPEFLCADPRAPPPDDEWMSQSTSHRTRKRPMT
ncbi:hypothetical protein F2Q68_00035218 [Brassica cretica]|uniref:Arabidopsis retrotransposon Orf1 C-terminal domain-containing protein n=1 Tax=Brassica cretica TaxID=69181 RepID=A0A8S9H3L1_BRACR|nr:hypothetical protein F2Q68_00035218 [Brassica cretica]